MTVGEARSRFQSHLHRVGLRTTSQRLAILEAAHARPDHFTAEELLDSARAVDDSVSRATVYRTLPLLIEGGLLREIDVGRNIKLYAAHAQSAATIPLAQVVCEDCRRIVEIAAPFLDWYARSVSDKVGLEPASARLQVHATCPAHRQRHACDHHPGDRPAGGPASDS